MVCFTGEAIYERRKQLQTKYCNKYYKANTFFMYYFFQWFITEHFYNHAILLEGKRLDYLILKRQITIERALDLFCDYSKLDRTSWRVHLYRE